LTVLGAALGALLLSGGVATQAQAGNTMFCDQQVAAAAYCFGGTAQYLTGTEAQNYFSSALPVCAGAYLQVYACGSFGYAEKCYPGTVNTTPAIKNDYTLTQHMYGWAYWGSDPCP